MPLYNRVITKTKKPFTLDGYGRNILFDAISSGDKDTMNIVFDNEEAPLDIQDNNRDSLLHFVKDGELNLIEFLIEKGVPPTLRDIHGKTIIFYLSERIEKSSSELDIKHLTKLIDLALKSKTSLEQKDKDGNNLLLGFLNTLNKPLSKYAQKTFLSDLISKFIDSGVNIDEKNNEGDNALLVSVLKNDLDSTELLITKGAEINIQNKEGVTPLALAIMQGNNEFAEMVELLLHHNADPNTRDTKGVTLIEKIIYILIYINKENSKKERTKTSDATSSEEEDNFAKFNEDDYIRNIFEIITSREMIDFKFNDSLGNPYFFILVITENNFLADMLIKSGTHINQLNKDKKNLLQYYLEFVQEHKIDDVTASKIIKNIIKMGINLNHRDDNGATVLHNALLTDTLAMTRQILRLGGSIDVVDKKGRTLLHNAIWANDIEKVKFIVGTKADLVNTPDKLGVLPINYAAF
ncbi:MAG: ankyrin repeat domain-containing protein, partial [Campylobacteraceae bacterium]|nr:ankyrin repeat domain-containing protein [Campylobacteraceae bacterium]